MTPEFKKSESKKMAEKTLALAVDEPGYESVNADIADSAREIAIRWRDCNDKLTTRRNVSIGFLLAAGLVPAGILYVGKREDHIATP